MTLMDHDVELARTQVEQFKKDRWLYAIGHVGATAALIGVAWPIADHANLLWFGLVHHLANWVLVLGFFLPFRSEPVNKMPLWTYVGAIVGNATLSSALLFDLNAASELSYTLTVGIILFAGAAGSFVTLGVHSALLRVALTSLLLPYVVVTFYLGHIAIALGTMGFYTNVVVAGVWKLASGQKELIALRVDAANQAKQAQIDAQTDHLTGLANRRGVERLEGMELTTGVTALYFDVNKFKLINDTYGHGVGDEILQAVAQRIRGAVGANDVVARLGGDEFLALIFCDNTSDTDMLIARLNRRLQQPVEISDGSLLEVSASIGRSHTDGPVLKLEELLRDSDEAMYQAKGELSQSSINKFAA